MVGYDSTNNEQVSAYLAPYQTMFIVFTLYCLCIEQIIFRYYAFHRQYLSLHAK